MSEQSGVRHAKFSVVPMLLIAVLFLLGLFLVLWSKTLAEDSGWKTALDLLGSVVIVAIPVELLRELFFYDVDHGRIMISIGDLFDRKVSTLIGDARVYGLDRLQSELDFARLFDDLQSSDTLWWLDTFSPEFRDWISSVQRALERGATIKMLVIQPHCANGGFRADELGKFYTRDDFEHELKSFLNSFAIISKEAARTGRGKLEIRLYDNLLGCPAYVVERDTKPIYAYSSIYLNRPTADKFPHFRWTESQGAVLQMLRSYIVTKFENSDKTYPDSIVT